MGGNALKSVITERKTTEEYNNIASVIIPIFEKELGISVHLVKSYHEKETHGDMDLLIKITHEFYNKGINLKTFVEDVFKPGQIFNNGSVISFDYEKFQIDLIPIKESNWEVAKSFFNYSPIGNLLGKIVKQFNFNIGD